MKHPMNIKWIDRGFPPRNPPDPAYPDGIDLDMSNGAVATCAVTLPYPSPRCGYFAIKCPACGISVVVTTAGRRDDPRSLIVACNKGTLVGA